MIADGLHLWSQARTGFSPLGVSQNDCPNVATCRQPFPVVSADRPPARRFIVPNPICNQPGKTLDLCTRDGDRLLSVNFLQVLDPTFGEVDKFGGIGGKIVSEFLLHLGCGSGVINRHNKRQLVRGELIKKIILGERVPFACRRVPQLPSAFRQALRNHEHRCPDLHAMAYSQRVQ